jgi:hypothetical protein
MAVTMLLSLTRNWMWICHGGSCNIFSFLPIKTLLLSNILVHKNLSKKMSDERFGESVFPMFDVDQEDFFAMGPELRRQIVRFQAASLSPQSSVS